MGFNDILANIHDSGTAINMQDTPGANDSNYIEINSKRQFIPSSDFDTVIAYEGDINTQIVTFKCAKTYDGHDLSACDGKIIRWKNLKSGVEGVSVLTSSPATDLILIWEVPADACTIAGAIEISIEIYDLNGSGKKVYSWNTASYNGLSIGKSMNSVAVGNTIPADKILLIDADTKKIIAPVGYNNTICNYGEKGFVEVYFLIDKIIFNKFSNDPSVSIYVKMNEYFGNDLQNVTISDYENGMKLITWAVPAGITAGKPGPGEIQIAVSISDGSNFWNTNTYSKLMVANSILGIPEETQEEWSLFTDMINNQIDFYLQNNNFIIDAND